jgi:UDP-glucose 4-epimerase
MKILVTGGAGFIGSHVVDAYIAQGHTVTVIDNLATGYREFLNPKARFYQIDIADRAAVREVFARERFDLVNHHAAQVDVRVSVADPLKDAHTNILGLLTVLEACREFSVKKFIFISSGGVIYGEPQQLPRARGCPQKAHQPLRGGQARKRILSLQRQADLGLRIYRAALRERLRAAPDPQRVKPRSSARLRGRWPAHEPVTIFGDGRQTRDFIFVSDVVAANLLATERIEEINRASAYSIDDLAFNIGTGQETSVNELFERFERALSRKCEARYAPPRPGELQRNALDITKAQKLLGFVPKIALEEGLRVTMAWVRTTTPS